MKTSTTSSRIKVFLTIFFVDNIKNYVNKIILFITKHFIKTIDVDQINKLNNFNNSITQTTSNILQSTLVTLFFTVMFIISQDFDFFEQQ